MDNTQISIAVFAYKKGFSEALKMIMGQATDATIALNEENLKAYFAKVEIKEQA